MRTEILICSRVCCYFWLAECEGFLGWTSRKRRGCEALHHPWHLSCVWYEQRSTCRDWIAFWRRQVFCLNDKSSAQLLIGIAGGIRRYGWLRGAALLGSGHGINQPKRQCRRCDCANNGSHEVAPFISFSRGRRISNWGGSVRRWQRPEQSRSGEQTKSLARHKPHFWLTNRTNAPAPINSAISIPTMSEATQCRRSMDFDPAPCWAAPMPNQKRRLPI
jgi:hypothetical protein